MLDTQLVDIPLQGGLAENVDKRLVPLGAWLTLKNCRRNKELGLSKRFGTEAMTMTKVSGGSISSCVAMGVLDSTLILLDATTIYTRSTGTSLWTDRSSTLDTTGAALSIKPFPVTLAHRTIYGTANRIVTVSQCRSSDGLIHFAYEQVPATGADNAVYDLVIDELSGDIVRGPQLVDSIGYAPRVMNCNGKIVVVYSNGTASPATIKARSKPTTTSPYGGSTNLAVDQYTNQAKSVWDAQAIGGASNNFALSYESSLLNGLHTKIFDSSFVLQNAAVWSVVESDYRTVAIQPVSGEGIWAAVAIDFGGIVKIRASRLSDTTAVEQFAPVIVLDGTPLGLAVSSVGTPGRLVISRTDATHCAVLGSGCESLMSIPCIWRNTLDSTGTAGVTPVVLAGYQIASRAFIAVDNRQYCWISDLSYLNATTALARSLYLLDTEALTGENGSGRIVSRGPMRVIDAGTNNFFMSRVVTDVIVNGNNVYFPCASMRQLQVNQYPIEYVTAKFNDPARHKVVQFAASAIISPLQVFDRNKLIELGFHRIPSYCTATDGGAGALNAGTYGYVCVLRHINSCGEVTRSSPGAAGTITIAVSHQIAVHCSFGSLTDRQPRDAVASQAQPEYVVAELYRTVANGQTFYLVQEQPLPVSGTSFASITFSDNMTDTVAQSKPLLYTTGGIAPNLSPPNLKSICNWRNHLCGIGPDGHTIWISSEYVNGEQVSFNEAFNCYVAHDSLTALGVLDDKLLAFSVSNIYLIDGQTADGLGQNNSLAPNMISADFGCSDPRAVVAHDEGLMFKSRRSFGIVTRNLEVNEIGLPVQDKCATYPVVKTTADLDYDREVRFCMAATESASTGIVLTYNSSTKEWYWHEYRDSVGGVDSVNLVASTVVDGVWYAAPSNGAVLRETQTAWTDAGVYVESDYETPQIDLTTIANFKRFKRLFAQMERKTAHDLEVSIFTDGNDTASQVVVFTDAQIATFPKLPIEQIMVHIANQKSNMVRVRFRDRLPSGGTVGTGQGVVLYGLTMRVGVKKGFGSQVGEVQKG